MAARRPVTVRRLTAALAFSSVLVLAGCGDGDEEEPVRSVPDTSDQPASTNTAPSEDGSDTGGAEPGSDAEDLDPPGGTTPTPDPGGDDDGSNGQGVNPDTDNDGG